MIESKEKPEVASQRISMKVTRTMKAQWQAKATAQGKTLSGWIKGLCNA